MDKLILLLYQILVVLILGGMAFTIINGILIFIQYQNLKTYLAQNHPLKYKELQTRNLTDLFQFKFVKFIKSRELKEDEKVADLKIRIKKHFFYFFLPVIILLAFYLILTLIGTFTGGPLSPTRPPKM